MIIADIINPIYAYSMIHTTPLSDGTLGKSIETNEVSTCDSYYDSAGQPSRCIQSTISRRDSTIIEL